jgi:hypothetical protein
MGCQQDPTPAQLAALAACPDATGPWRGGCSWRRPCKRYGKDIYRDKCIICTENGSPYWPKPGPASPGR